MFPLDEPPETIEPVDDESRRILEIPAVANALLIALAENARLSGGLRDGLDFIKTELRGLITLSHREIVKLKHRVDRIEEHLGIQDK